MKLRPLDRPELIRLVADWLSRKENYKWLDFGQGRRLVAPEWLKIMTQQETHLIRVYTLPETGDPIGVVGLDSINRRFGTARLWVVAGDKAHTARGYATRASSRMLSLAFGDLGLHAVHTWIVEHNPSLQIALRLNFKLIGRQRQCHRIDGALYDRLWLDILGSEHRELD